ncbi:MAG TPA: UvrD-helicase domain-containing protein [Bacteroidales bacterium]|nr:UvrD-helicase domain-containing protein [Bacteroidales bacterium]
MTQGKLTRYSASAGSGKTYILTGEYLKFLFSNRYNYRKILAVTFTNKAAAEMKERILTNLFLLSGGSSSDYVERLKEHTGKDEEYIRKEAGVILRNILHDYSRFSVGTIDSFFQKILRSFAQESGLHAGFNLILDHTSTLSDSYDSLLKDLEEDPQLLNWLIDFSRHELEEGDDWNLRKKVLDLGQELFKEVYRILDRNNKIVKDRKVISDSINELYAIIAGFRSEVKIIAGASLQIIDLYSLSETDFLGGSKGMLPFLTALTAGIPDKFNNYVRIAVNENRWSKKDHYPENLKEAVENGLGDKIKLLLEYYDNNITGYRTAEEVLKNIFTMGIISDLSRKTRELVSDENRFLLSDAGDVISQIIGEDQAPFIYEKIGIRYANFMIDEFQDTSQIQWSNFNPLIRNSMAEGDNNLVVGDTKQSIYRWRNSDWNILRNLHSQYRNENFENEKLDNNWRSCANIIQFNNYLFTVLPGLLYEQAGESGSGELGEIYSDVKQRDPGKKEDGYIRIKAIKAIENEHQEDLVLNELPGLLEEIQDNGYEAHEIGILVRKHDQGKKIIERLMEYSMSVSGEKKHKYSYQIISQDSLFLYLSPAVNLIISALCFLTDSTDHLNKANLIYSSVQSGNTSDAIDRPLLLGITDSDAPDKDLPPGYREFFSRILHLPLFEMIEEIIVFFGLSHNPSNIPFITTFQDLVLEFSSTETNDIPSFLEWWESEGQKKTVSSSDQKGAIQLMTIHKSKGLQFKVVIMPFLSWRFFSERNPVLWVSTEENPFNKIGSIPVRYRQQLENTYYSEYYLLEKDQQVLDNLNLLYVAFTRSEECIYGYIPQGKIKRRDAGYYIIKSFENRDIASDVLGASEYWDDERGVFEFGSVPLRSHLEKKETDEKPIDIDYLTGRAESRLIFKLHGSEAVSIMDEERRSRIRYGILMHDIFAGIRSPADIDKTLNNMLGKGIIVSGNIEMIKQDLKRLLKQEKISDWFDRSNRIKTEADILLDSGQTKRPDRVVFFDDRVEVIDFKFGTENEINRKQVQEYVEILVKMGYENVKGFLWYVNMGKVEPV